MSQTLPKIVAVVGPTASGKSDLAIEIALSFKGEVISADSRQVYKGMDIGTGKVTPKEMRGVPHHLLDIADPMKTVSAGTYKILADTTITEILSRGHFPILCGGTGFYIEAVTEGVELPNVPADPPLRKTLSTLSANELFKMLEAKDPERAKTIDAKNPHRLIRAIEISIALGKVPPRKVNPPYETLFIGIELPDEVLRERIHKRLMTRMDAGMLEEIMMLHEQGVSWERMEEFGLEYRYLSRYAQGILTKEEMLEELLMEIIHYAKRQYTWFRKNKQIHWVPLGDIERAKKLVAIFLNSSHT